MRKYMETGFYIVYFVLIMAAGVLLVCRGRERARRGLLFFGLACLLLVAGDTFHLVPRSIGLFAGNLDSPDAHLAMWLGIGKLITSVTMTLFYVLAYLFIYRRAGRPRPLVLDVTVAVLVVARMVLLALPQNAWLTNDTPLLWGIVRNIPFNVLGFLVILLSFAYLRGVRAYRLLWLAIVLSFGFYLPVVLLASTYTWVGLLMIPKTVCYLWIAAMGVLDGRAFAAPADQDDGCDGALTSVIQSVKSNKT